MLFAKFHCPIAATENKPYALLAIPNDQLGPFVRTEIEDKASQTVT